jgi:hypothetical protein
MDELHHIGVNLNQIARHANPTGQLRADLDTAHAEVMRDHPHSRTRWVARCARRGAALPPGDP